VTERWSIPARLWRLAKSRRVSVALIAALAVYVAIGTLIAQGPYEDPLVRAWASAHPLAERLVAFLGLHDAYGTPVFLGLVVLLVISTAACSVERTGQGLRILRRTRASAEGIAAERFRAQASFVVADALDSEAALAAAETGLRKAGLRVHRSGDFLEGFAGRWGALGSPAFHWCLALLGLALIVGQATRAEGRIDVPIGAPVRDQHAAYTRIAEGALFGERHTGLTIETSDLVYNFGAGGVNRGPAPVITLRDSGGIVAQQRVFPNNPLRYGPLMVHMSAYGVAPVVAVEATSGPMLATKTTLLEFSRETSSGTIAQEFGLAGGTLGGGVAVRIEMVADRDSDGVLGRVPRSPHVLISTMASGDTTFGAPAVLGLGGPVTLPDGARLRFVSVQNWVGLSVANDWSVSAIYLLSGLACVCLLVSLFVPTRGGRIMLEETDSGASLGVSAWHVRRDAAFRERIHAVAREAAGEGADAEPVRNGWRSR
jgi:hypothetical protein